MNMFLSGGNIHCKDLTGAANNNFSFPSLCDYFHFVLLSTQHQKTVKNAYQKFPELKVTSSNILFCPKPKDIQFIDPCSYNGLEMWTRTLH